MQNNTATTQDSNDTKAQMKAPEFESSTCESLLKEGEFQLKLNDPDLQLTEDEKRQWKAQLEMGRKMVDLMSIDDMAPGSEAMKELAHLLLPPNLKNMTAKQMRAQKVKQYVEQIKIHFMKIEGIDMSYPKSHNRRLNEETIAWLEKDGFTVKQDEKSLYISC